MQMVIPGWDAVSTPDFPHTVCATANGMKGGVEQRHHGQALWKCLQWR